MLPPGPHDPSFFDDQYDEALRPVELTLALISRDEYFSKSDQIPIDPSRAHPRPGETDTADDGACTLADAEDPAFPTLYFAGESHGIATVRGKVSTLADGAVRWQFVSGVSASVLAAAGAELRGSLGHDVRRPNAVEVSVAASASSPAVEDPQLTSFTQRGRCTNRPRLQRSWRRWHLDRCPT